MEESCEYTYARGRLDLVNLQLGVYAVYVSMSLGHSCHESLVNAGEVGQCGNVINFNIPASLFPLLLFYFYFHSFPFKLPLRGQI